MFETLMVITLAASLAMSFMALFIGWAVAGLVPIRDEVVNRQGRRISRFRLIVGAAAIIASMAFWLWTAATTELAAGGALLGTTAIVATIFLIVLPIWSLKNLTIGPSRLWGAIGLVFSIILLYPPISTALEWKDFWPTYIRGLQGEATLAELAMDFWRTALDFLW